MTCNFVKHSIQYCPAGESTSEFLPGDFILVSSNSLLSKLIKFGQNIRFPKNRLNKWTHCALIVDTNGNLIEANAKGIVENFLATYHNSDYFLVRIDSNDQDRAEIVNFARSCLGDKYGIFTFLSIGLTLLTGSKFSFSLQGQEVCSGLVARSLERTNAIFPTDASHISPSQLAQFYLS